VKKRFTIVVVVIVVVVGVVLVVVVVVVEVVVEVVVVVVNQNQKKPVFQTIRALHGMFNYGKDATQNYQCLNTCACYHTTLCAYIQAQIDENQERRDKPNYIIVYILDM
jgi:hypothetical protein